MAIWETWQPVAAAVLTVSFMLMGFAYMLGIGFNLTSLKAWARNEFYQVLMSAIIVGAMVLLIPTMNAMMNSITGEIGVHSSCDATKWGVFCIKGSGYHMAAFDYAKNFLDGERDQLISNYVALLGTNVGLGILLSAYVYTVPYQQGVSFSLFPGFSTITDFISMMMMFIGGGAVLLTVNSMVLDYIRFKLMGLFPIGIALRTFPFTRSAGGAIIALVVGLYFLYPMLFFLDAQMFENDKATMSGMGLPPGGAWVSGIPGIGTIMSIIYGYNRPVYDVFVVGMFLPLFNITITITFTRELAKFLGGDIDISSLTKLL